MSGSVVRLPAASVELRSTARYLRLNGGPDLAVRFLRDADRTFAAIAARPGIGTPYPPDDPRFVGLRCFPLSLFKSYIVFCRTIAGGIEVWNVLHGARDDAGILADQFGEEDDADP